MIAIIILSPIMLIIAFIVKTNNPGPIFYRGIRAGINGAHIKIIKFRTMVFDAENKGGYSTAFDDHRFTSVGRFLRRYKFDELPQLFNVINGDMSLVGPRPQVLFYTKEYIGDEKLILSVKPGITDIASLYFFDMDTILGSGNVDSKYKSEIEPIKNRLRLRYVRERSLLLDMRILIETGCNLIGINNVTGLDISP